MLYEVITELVDHFLDLARVDVVTARDDEIGGAATQPQATVPVEVADVAGNEPAVVESLRCLP